jgi:hypothetical protein
MKKIIFVLALSLHVLGCKEKNTEQTKIIDSTSDSNIIAIEQQGAFAVGGTVKESPGTFDPIAHGAFNPTDQSTFRFVL